MFITLIIKELVIYSYYPFYTLKFLNNCKYFKYMVRHLKLKYEFNFFINTHNNFHKNLN